MQKKQIIKVLIAKPGLDGHDRGAKILLSALRDHGMEVIYTGRRQTPQMISQTALQEDVDVVGLSCLSGAHNQLFPEVVELLQQHERGDILVIGGGVIPTTDIPYLQKKGIKMIFGPGSTTSDIISFIRENTKENES
ncbi:cobalamin B12-binding domain-containing protein [Chloroflexota bacterium]